MNDMSRDNDQLYINYINAAKNVFMMNLSNTTNARKRLIELHNNYRQEYEKLQMDYFTNFQQTFQLLQNNIDSMIKEEINKLEEGDELLNEFKNLSIND